MKPPKWITLYVLELQDGCFYVGQSEVPEIRIRSHVRGKGSQWTKKHPPICLSERRPAESRDWKEAEFVENQLTLMMMRKHGWQRVRGGYWCNVDEELTRKGLLAHGRQAEIACSAPLETSAVVAVEQMAPSMPIPFTRAFLPWDERESERLMIDYLEGLDADALAIRYGRSIVAVAARLVRLGVIEHRREVRRATISARADIAWR